MAAHSGLPEKQPDPHSDMVEQRRTGRSDERKTQKDLSRLYVLNKTHVKDQGCGSVVRTEFGFSFQQMHDQCAYLK